MHPSRSFTATLALILTLGTVGVTTPIDSAGSDGAAVVGGNEVTAKSKPYFMSHEQMMHWLANTDAELTFIGKPINPLTPRSAQDTVVTYCNIQILDVWGGTCIVYNGGATCLNAPGTTCLAATNDVAFCNGTQCTGNCGDYYDCSTSISDCFCSTPGTLTIFVSGA